MQRPQTLLVLVFLCFYSLTSPSQDIGFGIFAGPNFYITSVESRDGDNRFGASSSKTNLQYHIGAFIDYNFSSELGIVGNIVYQYRGLSLNPEVKFNFLEINPLLKYDLNHSYGSGFYLKGGFRYSFLLTAKTFRDGVDVKETFKNSNFGFIGGFGADITNYLGLELLFDYSPMNIFKDVEGESITSRLMGGNFRVVFYIEKVLNNN